MIDLCGDFFEGAARRRILFTAALRGVAWATKRYSGQSDIWNYSIHRLLLAVTTFFVVTVVAFFIVMLVPKQPLPLLMLCMGCISPELSELIRAELGINQPPLHVKYFD